MCDYSLCGLPNRLPVEGETLEVYRFSTGSIGLISARELRDKTAAESPTLLSELNRFVRNLSRHCPGPMVVCIPPGAELVLRDIPASLRKLYGVDGEECVRFAQTSLAVSAYRDAIQFRKGAVVGLQELPEGLRAEVLSLTGHFAGWQPRISDSEPFVSQCD